jgi:hypothetical protein
MAGWTSRASSLAEVADERPEHCSKYRVVGSAYSALQLPRKHLEMYRLKTDPVRLIFKKRSERIAHTHHCIVIRERPCFRDTRLAEGAHALLPRWPAVREVFVRDKCVRPRPSFGIRIAVWSKDLDLGHGQLQCTDPFIPALHCGGLGQKNHFRVAEYLIAPDARFRAPCCQLLLYLMSALSVILLCSGISGWIRMS